MTRPVPEPTSPESTRSSGGRDSVKPNSGKFDEAMQKIEAVSEVSETEFEKPGKRPFYESSDEDEEITGPSSSRFEDLHPLPSPDTAASESSEHTDDLPRSKTFWQKEKLPNEPLTSTNFEEQPLGKTKKGAVHLPATQKKAASKMVSAPVKKQKEEQKTSAVPWQSPAPSMPSTAKKEEKEDEEPLMPTLPGAKQPREQEEKRPAPFTPSTQKKESKKRSEQHLWEAEEPKTATSDTKRQEERERKTKQTQEHAMPIPDPFPPPIQAAATAAQIAATAYLSPQTAELFSKLIGTLLFMVSATPGIVRTEITLNSEPFRNSVFFNTTIILEKYATAPDSFNIRLQGSPEAVKLFQENGSLLLGAFATAYEERRVHFRIGRMEAAIERPLFRRKESVDEREGGRSQ